MTTSDLDLLSRAGAELAVMMEMTYAPERLLRENPEGAALLIELTDRLAAANAAIPDNLSFIVSFLPRDTIAQ